MSSCDTSNQAESFHDQTIHRNNAPNHVWFIAHIVSWWHTRVQAHHSISLGFFSLVCLICCCYCSYGWWGDESSRNVRQGHNKPPFSTVFLLFFLLYDVRNETTCNGTNRLWIIFLEKKNSSLFDDWNNNKVENSGITEKPAIPVMQ